MTCFYVLLFNASCDVGCTCACLKILLLEHSTCRALTTLHSGHVGHCGTGPDVLIRKVALF